MNKRIVIILIVILMALGAVSGFFLLNDKNSDDQLGEIGTTEVYPQEPEEEIEEDNDELKLFYVTTMEQDGEKVPVIDEDTMPINNEGKADYENTMSKVATKVFGEGHNITFYQDEDKSAVMEINYPETIEKYFLSNKSFEKLYQDDRENARDFVVPEQFKEDVYRAFAQTVKENYPAERFIVIESNKEVFSTDY